MDESLDDDPVDDGRWMMDDDLVSGGVMALPTLRNMPPRSNMFIALIASCTARTVSANAICC
jgi:hypothetical protein